MVKMLYMKLINRLIRFHGSPHTTYFNHKLNEHFLRSSIIAGAAGVFNGVPDPVLMGQMSRIVAEDEQGRHSNSPANHVALTKVF